MTLEVSGDPYALPAGVELTAYRIAQEALTNVVRHAHARQARVSLVYRPGFRVRAVIPVSGSPTRTRAELVAAVSRKVD